ncbi:MAG: MmcQ/YjbR family DNA-binding protein [Ornithinimicrobium sp.]
MVTESDVRRAALNLPGAYEKASYGGSPSWRTKPRVFARLRDEDDALVLWVETEEEKEALVTSDPEKFFTTNHYDGYSVVLVRMTAIDVPELAELIEESWRHRAPRSLTSKKISKRAPDQL